MEKFNSVELSIEDTTPTSICSIYLEYIKFYCQKTNGAGSYLRVTEFIEERMEKSDSNGDGIYKLLEKLLEKYAHNNKAEKKDLVLMWNYLLQIPVEFSIQAIQSEINNKHQQAWVYALDAAYWVGMVKGFELTHSSRNALSINALKGAKARSAKYDPLKQMVENLVNEKSFKSRRQAAMTIKPAIIAESRQLNIPLSEAQAELTIYGWLKNMGLPANI